MTGGGLESLCSTLTEAWTSDVITVLVLLFHFKLLHEIRLDLIQQFNHRKYRFLFHACVQLEICRYVIILKVKNTLKRREECDTYLTHA